MATHSGLAARRRCSSCGGTARWHDEAWVCDRCGDEWDSDHDAVQYARPIDLTQNAIERVARKAWRCICAEDGPNRAGRTKACPGDIRPGDAYVEYLGETGDYQAGSRYCLACGYAAWNFERWGY